MACNICYSSELGWIGKCIRNHHVCMSCACSKVCPVCNSVLELPSGLGLGLGLGLGMVWLYEGRNNGWWYYGPDMQRILEKAYQVGKSKLSWYTCGQVLHIDLKSMQQINPSTDGVRRVIRISPEQHSLYLIKGTAGLS
jgi:hypothetical protein